MNKFKSYMTQVSLIGACLFIPGANRIDEAKQEFKENRNGLSVGTVNVSVPNGYEMKYVADDEAVSVIHAALQDKSLIYIDNPKKKIYMDEALEDSPVKNDYLSLVNEIIDNDSNNHVFFNKDNTLTVVKTAQKTTPIYTP